MRAIKKELQDAVLAVMEERCHGMVVQQLCVFHIAHAGMRCEVRGLSTWVEGSLWHVAVLVIYVAKVASDGWALAVKNI